jgi:hypothetical protein
VDEVGWCCGGWVGVVSVQMSLLLCAACLVVHVRWSERIGSVASSAFRSVIRLQSYGPALLHVPWYCKHAPARLSSFGTRAFFFSVKSPPPDINSSAFFDTVHRSPRANISGAFNDESTNRRNRLRGAPGLAITVSS